MPGAIASGEDVIDHSFFAFFSKSLGLQIEHRAITAARRYQLVVRTEFDDAPMLENADPIGVPHRRKAM
jgi:hypothetical protein